MQPNNFICHRENLKDGGLAHRFSIEFDGRTLPGFVVAFNGEVYAWVNICPHRGTELDWQPGQVFDDSGLYLICATHGALFDADSGLCVSGPCTGSSLRKIDVVVDEAGNVILRRGRVC
jgi:nitrite reductase/ring-hydroxylating ferredoxin subunit